MTSEALLIHALNNTIEGLPAYGDVPANRPDEFITVERTGGAKGKILDAGTYAVQVWATTRSRAASLADKTAAYLNTEAPQRPEIAAVNVASAYNFPDPDSRTPRYQLTVNATTALAGG